MKIHLMVRKYNCAFLASFFLNGSNRKTSAHRSITNPTSNMNEYSHGKPCNTRGSPDGNMWASMFSVGPSPKAGEATALGAKLG